MSLPKETMEILEALIPELRESEDEKIRKFLLKVISDIAGGWPFEKYGITQKGAIAWLEKQKERGEADFREGYLLGFEDGQKEQKPAGWSEDDEQWLESIIKDYEDNLVKDKDHAAVIKVKIDFLKSLRPSWKPSEEQMEAMKKSLAYWRGTTKEIPSSKLLESLYNALEKLGVKEEPEYYQHFDPDC